MKECSRQKKKKKYVKARRGEHDVFEELKKYLEGPKMNSARREVPKAAARGGAWGLGRHEGFGQGDVVNTDLGHREGFSGGKTHDSYPDVS